MFTAILMVFAVVLTLGMVGMFFAACRGEFFATVWVCFGGMQSCGELLAECIGAIVKGLTEG